MRRQNFPAREFELLEPLWTKVSGCTLQYSPTIFCPMWMTVTNQMIYGTYRLRTEIDTRTIETIILFLLTSFEFCLLYFSCSLM